MNRSTWLLTVLVLAAWPLAARAQQQESLGDVARKLQAEQARQARKATIVFTNDNLPAPRPMEPVNQLPRASTPPAADKTGAKTEVPPPAAEAGSKPAEPEGDKVKTRDYWQDKFRTARQNLANAKEQQQLSEDELNLLQIQQAREINPLALEDLNNKVAAKQAEVDTNNAATAAADKALDDLDKAFKDSGAPEEWGQTEPPADTEPPPAPTGGS